MTEINIESRFKSLRDEAGKIKSLLLQEQLKQQRALSGGPAILNNGKFANEDLRNICLLFQMRIQEIRYVLNHKIVPSITRSKCKILMQRLRRIESDMEQLNLSANSVIPQ